MEWLFLIFQETDFHVEILELGWFRLEDLRIISARNSPHRNALGVFDAAMKKIAAWEMISLQSEKSFES